MTLTPYRVHERGKPTWIMTQVEISQAGVSLLATVVSVTEWDMPQLCEGLLNVLAGRRESFALTTEDGNLVVVAESAESPEHVFVGVWVGEPYMLMKGYRFAAISEEIRSFCYNIEVDQRVVLETTGPC